MNEGTSKSAKQLLQFEPMKIWIEFEIDSTDFGLNFHSGLFLSKPNSIFPSSCLTLNLDFIVAARISPNNNILKVLGLVLDICFTLFFRPQRGIPTERGYPVRV